jgi:hypothetical protein
MDPELRAAVRERAANSCEYCQRRQIDAPLIPLQIEHIVARKHGGGDQAATSLASIRKPIKSRRYSTLAANIGTSILLGMACGLLARVRSAERPCEFWT